MTDHSSNAPAYRPDIDGLRAIAVAAVVLYHAGIPGFGGGYAGVDVFFVISGYLITLLIVGSERGASSRVLANFYLRRGRRILPALFVVAILTAAVSCFVLLPWDLTRLGKYLAATPMFLSNWAAWSDGGYFNAGLGHVALTHLWSIAVEEQFYLVYPVMLLLLMRFLPRHSRIALAALAGVSLVLCVLASHFRPVANYYLAPTRAWELMLGALVALGGSWTRMHRIAGEALAAAGLAAIALSICLYDSTMRYPGVYTLLPGVGTVLLIAAGQGQLTFAGRLLSLPPLVFTGLISYSLYLWHWPVLSLFGYYSIQGLGGIAEKGFLVRGLLLVAIYLIAWVSWKVIEKPIRSRAVLTSDRSFVVAAAGASMVLLAAGLVFLKSGGLPRRFPSDIQTLAGMKSGLHPDIARCMNSLEKIRSGALCKFGPEGANLPKVVVWGDSHAMALLPAFEKLAFSHRVQLYFTAASACVPLLDVTHGRRLRSQQLLCAKFKDAAVEAIRQLDPRVVILSGYWNYLNTAPQPEPALPPALGVSIFMRGMEQTLRQIDAAGRSVCVVLDVPELRYPVPYALAMARRRGIGDDFIGIARAQALDQQRSVEADLRELEKRRLFAAVDPKDALCRTDACVFQSGGKALYRDTNHLSIAGAEFVAETLAPCFQGVSSGQGPR